MAGHEASAAHGLVAEMNERQTVLGGWDAALHLRCSVVDAMVRAEWTVRTGCLDEQQVTLVWCEEAKRRWCKRFSRVRELALTLSPPALRLQPGEGSMLLRQEVSSVRLRAGILFDVGADFKPEACQCPPDDPKVRWKSWSHLDGDFHVTATVPLSCRWGTADAVGGGAVVLSFADSKLATDLSPPGVAAELLAARLKERLTACLGDLALVAFDFQDYPNLVNLRPKSVQTNQLCSVTGDEVLQILMSSSESAPEGSGIDLDEPIPAGDGSGFSLMVSSQIFFEKLLVPAYNRGAGEIKLVAVPPASKNGSWYAQVRNPMEYRGTINVPGTTPIQNSAELGFQFHGSVSSGLALATYVSPGANIDLQLDMAANFTFTTTSDEQGQHLELLAGPWSVTAGKGVAESAVKPLLVRFLSEDIKKDMTSISFRPFSALLQKNLRFPGQVPTFHEAYIPGDFLLLGTFKGESGEEAATVQEVDR